MIKGAKSKIGILLSLILIPFTSAYGGYSTFSIAQFTTVENIALFVFFLLAFFGIRKVLSKVFPNSDAAQVIVALVLSIMGIYGIMQTNFSFEIFLYTLGINEQLVHDFLPWIALFFVMIVWWKWKFPGLMFTIGGIFILLGLAGMASNSELVYNWEYAFGIGAVCLVVGAIFKKKLMAKIPKIPGIKGPNLGKIKNPLKGGRLEIVVEGQRITYPPFKKISMTIPPGKVKLISIGNAGSRDLLWKTIAGKGITTRGTRGVLTPRKDINVKIFSDSKDKTKSFTVSAIGRFGKISRQKIHVIVNPGTTSTPPSGGTNTPRPTRTRSGRELQKKYNYYSLLIKKAQRANKGKIPKKGTPEGDLRHRHIQAMQSIEKMAKNQGVKLK